MVKTIKARFVNGAIVPLEPLDIEEGEEVLVILEEQAPSHRESDGNGLSEVYGKWAGLGITEQDIAVSRVRFDGFES